MYIKDIQIILLKACFCPDRNFMSLLAVLIGTG